VLFDIISEFAIADLTNGRFCLSFNPMNSVDRQVSLGQEGIQNIQVSTPH